MAVMECKIQRYAECLLYFVVWKSVLKSYTFDKIVVSLKVLFQVIITDLGEIGENAIIVFEENVGVGAEETVANQEYVSFSNDNDDVIQVNLWHGPNMIYLHMMLLGWAAGKFSETRFGAWFAI